MADSKTNAAEEAAEMPDAAAVDVLAESEAIAELVTLLTDALGMRREWAERLAALIAFEPEEFTAELGVAEPVLTIGRIVHWHHERRAYPAIVTRVHQNECVDLAVFGSPFGTYASRLNVMPGEPGQTNRWSWPER